MKMKHKKKMSFQNQNKTKRKLQKKPMNHKKMKKMLSKNLMVSLPSLKSNSIQKPQPP